MQNSANQDVNLYVRAHFFYEDIPYTTYTFLKSNNFQYFLWVKMMYTRGKRG